MSGKKCEFGREQKHCNVYFHSSSCKHCIFKHKKGSTYKPPADGVGVGVSRGDDLMDFNGEPISAIDFCNKHLANFDKKKIDDTIVVRKMTIDELRDRFEKHYKSRFGSSFARWSSFFDGCYIEDDVQDAWSFYLQSAIHFDLIKDFKI